MRTDPSAPPIGSGWTPALPVTPRRTFLRRLRRNYGALVGLVLLVLLLGVALGSMLRTPADPYAIAVEQRFQPPTLAHPFGTDDLGRDVLSRIMVGTRISFGVAGFVLLTASGLGLPLGIIAGYRGGWIDELVMRTSDVFLAFPSFLLAMAIVAALEGVPGPVENRGSSTQRGELNSWTTQHTTRRETAPCPRYCGLVHRARARRPTRRRCQEEMISTRGSRSSRP